MSVIVFGASVYFCNFQFFSDFQKNREKKIDQFFSKKKNFGRITNLKIGFCSEFEYECIHVASPWNMV